jgi:cytochrome c biogenesis protein CcmG, thiol:disulfide interchange protein DsbE
MTETQAVSPPKATAGAPRRSVAMRLLPLAVFAALIGLFAVRLGAGDASLLPSTMLGKPAPKIELAGLDGGPGLTDADLRDGHVTLVNVFASWCQPCHFEHEYLMALASNLDLKAKGVRIVGIAQRDSAANIKSFLDQGGNPYAKIGMDPENRAGVDWGVYGVPETFVVRGDGVITYKFIGPMDPESIQKTLFPKIVEAMK